MAVSIKAAAKPTILLGESDFVSSLRPPEGNHHHNQPWEIKCASLFFFLSVEEGGRHCAARAEKERWASCCREAARGTTEASAAKYSMADSAKVREGSWKKRKERGARKRREDGASTE
eukprot:3807227-Rhodomonas_salina.2